MVRSSKTKLVASDPAVEFHGDQLRVKFNQFDQASYRLFLRCKRLPESVVDFDREQFNWTIIAPARFADLLGVEPPSLIGGTIPFSGHLFDDQQAVLKMALEAKRFAVWCECGWGKTPLSLEWARQVQHITNGRVLIVTLADIVSQWLEERDKFYSDSLPIETIKSKAHLREWCKSGGEHSIAITNYEKFNPESDDDAFNELRLLAGICLDESSRLRSSAGRQKLALTTYSKGIEYKLSCTATPAPNEVHEFFQQARFLEKVKTEADVITSFFKRNEKTHRWDIRPHGRQAFFEFMASWSIYIRDPRRYGWRQGHPDIPRPTYHYHEIEPLKEQLDAAREFATDSMGQPTIFQSEFTNAIQRVKLAQIARGFVYETEDDERATRRIPSKKPKFVAELARSEAENGMQVLIWTAFDAETEIIAKLLGNKVAGKPVEVITGSLAAKKRPEVLSRFKLGESAVLISRPRMLGYGVNLQCVGSMIWSDISDSFELLYQGIRRAYRYGQIRNVRVHFPYVEELESDSMRNLESKSARFDAEIGEMESCYLSARERLWGRIGA